MNETIRFPRVLTWNVHGFVDRDGKPNLERVGRWIGELAPDIAAFQEVDSRNAEPPEFDVVRYIRGKVGEHGHEAWAISGPDGEYGQVLASRFPLENCKVHDISVARREPRMAMDAIVRLPGLSLRVVATHLGLNANERRHQWAKLYDILIADLASPVVFLGDFNEWRRKPLPNRLAEVFGGIAMPSSFPSRLPVFPLDRIYCHPPSLLAKVGSIRAAGRASDHLPVLAEIDVPVGDFGIRHRREFETTWFSGSGFGPGS